MQRAAVGGKRHAAGDKAVGRFQVAFQVGLVRLEEEADVDQLGPARRDDVAELVLQPGVDRVLQCTMRVHQRIDAGAFEHDPALQPDRNIAGVDVATDAIGADLVVEALEQRRSGQPLAVQRHRASGLEADGPLGPGDRPFAARSAAHPGVLGRGLEAVDLLARQGHAEQVLVDRIAAVRGWNLDAGLGHQIEFVRAHVAGLALQLADRCVDHIVAEAAHRLVEAQLVVAHAGTAVGEVSGGEPVGKLQALLDDDIAVRTQHRILVEHARARPQQRHDELVPQRLGGIEFMMLGRTQRARAFGNPGLLRRINAAGVDKGGVHLEALLLQRQHAIAGIQPAGKCQYDLLLVHACLVT